jgi:tetratricopeptide (TPR) repeat protein
MNRHLYAFACTLAILTVSPLAIAGGNPEDACQSEAGRELWRDGRKAYDIDDYDTAIMRWKAAYDKCGEADLLFNLGQAHLAKKEYEKAKLRFKAYLARKKNIDPRDRDDVKKKIAKLEELIREQEASAESPPHGLRPQPEGEATPPANGQQPAPATSPIVLTSSTPTPPIDDEPPRRWYSDRWGWILAGTGTAAVLLGTGFLAWSYATEDDARSTRDQAVANDLFDDAESRRTIGAITTIAGGALVVVGVVHFALYARDGRETVRVSAGPSWIGVAWSFE